jgi:hypothetical protein
MVHYKIFATVTSLIGECPNGNKVGDRIEITRGKVRESSASRHSILACA